MSTEEHASEDRGMPDHEVRFKVNDTHNEVVLTSEAPWPRPAYMLADCVMAMSSAQFRAGGTPAGVVEAIAAGFDMAHKISGLPTPPANPATFAVRAVALLREARHGAALSSKLNAEIDGFLAEIDR